MLQFHFSSFSESSTNFQAEKYSSLIFSRLWNYWQGKVNQLKSAEQGQLSRSDWQAGEKDKSLQGGEDWASFGGQTVNIRGPLPWSVLANRRLRASSLYRREKSLTLISIKVSSRSELLHSKLPNVLPGSIVEIQISRSRFQDFMLEIAAIFTFNYCELPAVWHPDDLFHKLDLIFWRLNLCFLLKFFSKTTSWFQNILAPQKFH